MGYDLFAPGDDITDTRLNNLERQGIIQCASSASYPTDPTPGMVVYDSALHGERQYQSSTTGWTRKWDMPWGRMAEGVDAAAHMGFAGATTIASCDGFTSVANRLMRVEFRVCFDGHASSPGLGAFPRFQIYRIKDGGANTALGTMWQSDGVLEENRTQVTDWTTDTIIASGNYVYNLIAEATAGSNIDVRGDLSVTQILVEDIGPGFYPSDLPA